MKANKADASPLTTLSQAEQKLSEAADKYRKSQEAFKRADQNLNTDSAAYFDAKANFKRAVEDFNSKSMVQHLDAL